MRYFIVLCVVMALMGCVYAEETKLNKAEMLQYAQARALERQMIEDAMRDISIRSLLESGYQMSGQEYLWHKLNAPLRRYGW